ncbi:MAG: PfkB family carbohydrate kinase [Opitutales bacterium]|nr:PfkB family carbohydrate kinase [Opitutales bacterium]
MNQVDVLCIGYACWDLNFHITDHPDPDNKIFAKSLTSEGGGPAANAAYTIAKLGGQAALASRLGNDALGQAHLEELKQAGVDTSRILITDTPTSTSSIWVNKQGQRAVVNFKPDHFVLLTKMIDITTHCILVDGHEFEASMDALKHMASIPTLLDAGSLRDETLELSSNVSHLVASSSFARDLSQSKDLKDWLQCLAEKAPCAAVTCGQQGVHWQDSNGTGGHIKAPSVNAIDTTAAGDIFHGACALALAKGRSFPTSLAWANEVAGVSVTKPGGRSSSPEISEVTSLSSFR